MALIHMPFVGTTADTVLMVVATVVLFGSVAAAAYYFWKFHEIPLHEAERRDHPQMALVATLTWVGFFWHWVWVLAIILAYLDAGKMLRSIRDIWHEEK